ncbi:MAG: HD domain-containing protein [Eubacteriales bacterium]|nr:HD domain-containing protein [Eubacteriales bacterium]
MSKMRLLQQAQGQTFEGFVLIKSAAVRQNVKGADYLDLVLTDNEGEAVAKMWDYSPTTHGTFDADDIVKVRGSIVLWKDSEQLKIERIRHTIATDEVDMSLLVPCAPYDPQDLFCELHSLAEGFADDDLRRLVLYLMDKNKDKLLLFPAAVKLHHATRGGLIHHTWSIVQLCTKIIELYPSLNSDLLYSGAILHDIGKIKEMDTGALGLASAYTEDGQLIGHINIGVSMVDSAAEVLGISKHTAMLVEHMILSHHGQPEFGSPKLPMFPEAEVLSVCDMLDSKLYEMFSALDGILKGGFSERQWALDNRQLYRHDL